jgi:hypothetical protein
MSPFSFLLSEIYEYFIVSFCFASLYLDNMCILTTHMTLLPCQLLVYNSSMQSLPIYKQPLYRVQKYGLSWGCVCRSPLVVGLEYRVLTKQQDDLSDHSSRDKSRVVQKEKKANKYCTSLRWIVSWKVYAPSFK